MAEQIYSSISELVGRTPLVRLTRFARQFGLNAELIAKLEYFNPNHSVKDRIALAMIEDAERRGILQPGDTLVETTSGNTGIGLAALAAAKGYKFRVYINDFVSLERTRIIEAFGGEVIPFSTVPGFEAFYEESNGDFVAATRWLAETVIEKDPRIHFTWQLENPANPHSHQLTTGPEVWQDSGGQLDILIAAVGTGGTLSGAGSYLKQQNPQLQIIAVEPGIHSQPSESNPQPLEITGVHAFSNQPAERVPTTFDRSVVDEAFPVETWQAWLAAREVALSEGILIGESAGAVIHAAREVARRPENQGKRLVLLLADGGQTYLSSDLFNHRFNAHQIQHTQAVAKTVSPIEAFDQEQA